MADYALIPEHSTPEHTTPGTGPEHTTPEPSGCLDLPRRQGGAFEGRLPGGWCTIGEGATVIAVVAPLYESLQDMP